MQETFGCGVEEDGGIAGMEFAVSDYLIKLLHALRFHVDHIVDLGAVIDMPEVDPEVICREEVFSIR